MKSRCALVKSLNVAGRKLEEENLPVVRGTSARADHEPSSISVCSVHFDGEIGFHCPSMSAALPLWLKFLHIFAGGREVVAERFAWDHIAGQFIDCYRWVMEEGEAPDCVGEF